jgi:hypothetical protein
LHLADEPRVVGESARNAGSKPELRLQNRLLDEKVWAVKFLKAVRLDASDALVYSHEGAAQDGEWLVSGGYAVCDPTGATHRKPNCHCLTSFIGVVSHGRCTIAEVVEMDKSEYQQVIERLVRHFVDDLCAPTLEAAGAVAEEEARIVQKQNR